jgi:hypothetical protein
MITAASIANAAVLIGGGNAKKNPNPPDAWGLGLPANASANHFFIFKSAPLKVLTMATMSPSRVS